MSKNPFYHLRPNKGIDRTLFVQTLTGLNRLFPISTYRYTGFGSYLFDDFRALHDTLDITDMVSLEKDCTECERARYNVPYNCIDIKNISSKDYLSELVINDGEHNIFWLDFVDPSELGQQLADFATLLDRLNPNDIIRITLNANPASLGTVGNADEIQQNRIIRLRSRVKDAYLPPSLVDEDVAPRQYPITLLRILKSVAMVTLEDIPHFSPNFLFPLFSDVYADGQQMLTFTGIVLNAHEQEASIQDVLSNYAFINFLWDVPNVIEIPSLSIREITELNKLLPSPNIRQEIITRFPFVFTPSDDRAIESYISYYKFYPNFYKVSF